MFFKIALNNVKKSFKDYAIYFLTLTFGISLFYMFNSIEAQQAMLKVSQSQLNIMKTLSQVMGYVSMFVSVILAFLVIYSNQFLIKRRKKELGIYMTLGMERGKISKILILETITVGIFSLIAGLIIGVFLSQGLSIITAKMFLISLESFTFIFSLQALVRTIIYFGIVFLVVIFFNTIAVSRVKLIDLLYANKKNETLKVKSLWLSVILFIISLACLGVAYHLIRINGMREVNTVFTMSIILGSIGTFLFFMSLSGFMLKLVQSKKGLYLKDLNMFVLRQINNRINTTYISMTVICLMLLIAIGTLSTGLGISQVMNNNMKKGIPYDASIFFFPEDNDKASRDLAVMLKEQNVLNGVSNEYTTVNKYVSDVNYRAIINEDFDKEVLESLENTSVPMISLTDYNNALKLQGKEPIALEEDQFALSYSFADAGIVLNKFMKNNAILTLQGKDYIAAYEYAFEQSLENSQMPQNLGTLIVPDDVARQYNLERIILNLNYSDDKEKCEKLLDKLIDKAWEMEMDTTYHFGYMSTKQDIIDQGAGLKTIVSYLGIYIGLVFMITSVVVLALQQLSEASDNIERYDLLKKIGTEEKMINKALFKQIAIYFMTPLLLSIVHSIVGISVANKTVALFGELNILANSVFVAVFILVIYGGYFLTTYFSAKSIIKIAR